jgi:hypothetical protein
MAVVTYQRRSCAPVVVVGFLDLEVLGVFVMISISLVFISNKIGRPYQAAMKRIQWEVSYQAAAGAGGRKRGKPRARMTIDETLVFRIQCSRLSTV